MSLYRDAAETQQVVALSVHTHRFSSEEVVINSDVFGWVKAGDIVAIFPTDRRRTDRLALSVRKAGIQASKHGVATLKVSIVKSVAERFGLHSMQQVVVSRVDPQQIKLDSLQLTFDSQFLSRSVLWRISQALEGRCLYRGQRLTVLGHKLRVQHMFLNGAEITSGLVESFTKVNFRSRSARIIWLVQMSQEMWDFANDGDTFFEKALKTFFEPCFERWANLNAKHSLTVIFYTRTILNHHSCVLSLDRKSFPTEHTSSIQSSLHPRLRKSVLKDEQTGCLYEDLFYIVLENETASPWSSLIIKLKKAFIAFPKLANWKLATRSGTSASKRRSRRRRRRKKPPSINNDIASKESKFGDDLGCGLPSSAATGNFFEALNLALNIFDKHHMDRDLTRTGQALVVISPGMGLFEADRKLLLLTKRRLLDNGVGIDLLCLNSRPLHRVPLIIYKEDFQASSQASSDSNTGQIYYNIPHWLRISFPAQPNPIGDGFSPLPSHRMIDLLPEHNDDSDEGIQSQGRTSVRVPSTLRMFLENIDLGSDGLDGINTNIDSGLSMVEKQGQSGKTSRRNSAKSTKLRKLAHVYRTVQAPQPLAAIAEADDAKQWIQRSQSRLNLARQGAQATKLGARAHGIIPRPYSMTQVSATKSRTSRVSGGVDVSSSGSSGSGRMSQLEYQAHDMKVFSAPRYKEGGGSSSSGYSGYAGYASKGANSSGMGSGGSFEMAGASGMIGSSSYQNMNGALMMKNAIGAPIKFEARSTSRVKKMSRRRPVHSLSNSENVSNLTRSLLLNTEDSRTSGSNLVLDGSGKTSTGSIVRVNSNTVKWGATLQQAIPKTVLVKPNTSRSDNSEDGLLSRSFPNEKELASFMHLSKADRMALKMGKSSFQEKTPSIGTVDTKLASSVNSSSESPFNSPVLAAANSPQLHALQTSSPTRDRFGSPPRSPIDARLYHNISHRQNSGKAMIPLSLGAAQMSGEMVDDAESVRRSRRMHAETSSTTGRATSKRFASHIGAMERNYSELINPFKNENEQVERISSSRRRWRHLYTKAFDALRGSGLLSDDPYALDWPSLSSPAILPLTTDYFPTEVVLNLEYSITQQYTQCLPDTDELEEMGYTSDEELVRELVCQRLAQDFQIITAHDGAGEKLSGGLKYHLMFRHIIHKLTFDAASRNIEVTIYTHTRKSEVLSAASVYYQYTVLDPYDSVPHSVGQTFMPLQQTRWNTLDGAVLNFIDHYDKTVRYRRLHYLFIPPPVDIARGRADDRQPRNNNQMRNRIEWPTLKDEDEQQLAESQKAATLANPTLFQSDPPKSIKPVVPSILSWTPEQSSSDLRYASSHQDVSLHNASKLSGLRTASERDLVDSNVNSISKHLTHFKMICAHLQKMSIGDLDPMTVDIDESCASSLDVLAIMEESSAVKRQKEENTSIIGQQDRDTLRLSTPRTTKLRLKGRFRRHPEWIYVEYDKKFSTDRCYRLTLQFLVCSGATIQDFCAGLNKLCKQSSTVMMQVPEYTHPHRNPYIHAFYVPLHLPLPMAEDPILAIIVQDAIIFRYGFVLEADVEGSHIASPPLSSLPVDPNLARGLKGESNSLAPRFGTSGRNSGSMEFHTSLSESQRWAGRQYLHRSGVAFVRILRDGLLWIPNRLTETRDKWEDAQDLFIEFREFCICVEVCYNLVCDIVATAITAEGLHEE